ncbi:MAG: hypothetical protein E7619_04450 [Ruminococcaceae bacterium]|nr:hypothetical protein [Oscillospiraceae bacterium]
MKINVFVKKHFAELLITAISTAILLTAVVYGRTVKLNSGIDKLYEAVNAMAEDSDTVFDEALFVVREKEGKVAIFDYRTGKVIEELNVYTYSLPQTDRTYLENGIMIYTVSELVSLIEDYTG